MYTACLREGKYNLIFDCNQNHKNYYFNFADEMDELGLDPAIEYLRLVKLPSYPSILDEMTANVANHSRQKFDWINSIAMIKRHLSVDVLIGFSIYPNPINQTENLINLGKPKETILSL